jgi:signal transduction histidine kinase
MLAPFLLILLRQVPWVWAHSESETQQAGSEDEMHLPSRQGLLVLLGHIILLGGGIWFAFGAPRGVNLDYTYFVFLPLIWIALQYGFPRATATVLGINIGVAFLAGSRIGEANKLVLQFGLMAITFTGLILGAIACDRKHKQSKLQRLYREVQSLNIDLERQVQERTAQLQEQMQQLQQLNQLKDDFLSTVSHELRTPITNMKMAIRMLQIATNSERRDRYLQILQHECDREATLINDLLDLQRLEAGADPIAVETIQLQEWLPPIVAAFHERAIARQQTLKLDIAPDLNSLTSEPTKLKRIVTELLNNACKYTPPAGTITVKVRALTSLAEPNAFNRLELVVSNSGSEIPATELTRIFEKFYRLPSSDRTGQGGTGLGLAIVQKLVEQLGGQISASSQAEQITFTVEFPSLASGESFESRSV